jgi:hypothetical protein
MNVNKLLITLSVLLYTSCAKSTYNIYSPNKRQCITIITDKNIRYIINGCYSRVPESNFIKIDLKIVDRGAGDEIVGAWEKDNFKWLIIQDKAIIIQNKLDTTLYKFRDNFPVDENGIPTLKVYNGKGYFELVFDYSDLVHSKGAVIK